MFAVDTNILLHAANRGSPLHSKAADRVEAWRAGAEPWFVTWSILYEFLRVITHRGVFLRPLTFEQAWSFVEALLASPRLRVLVETDRHGEVVRDLVRECPWAAGNLMHDLHAAALMREHGVKEIRTTDTDFRKFGFLRVVDPLAE